MKYTVIIPHKDSVDSLFRLIKTIPNRDDLEIVIVDNSKVPLKIDDLKLSYRTNIKIAYSDNTKGAGCARNVGIRLSTGKWLLFADADDYYCESAFEIFDNYFNSDADIVYFACDSVYDDTLLPSNRHEEVNTIIQNVKNGILSEIQGRLYLVAPWAKMIKSDFVKNNRFCFDEVPAANDIYFSTIIGYHAEKVIFEEKQVYVITTRKGSLSNRWNKTILTSRYHVGLRRNLFLKNHNLSDYQISVMVYLYRAFRMSPILFFRFLKDAFVYRQNIFVGWRNWLQTFKSIRYSNKKNNMYIVNN